VGGRERGGGGSRSIQSSEQRNHDQGSSTASVWVQQNDDVKVSQQQAVTAAMQDSPAAQLSLLPPKQMHSTLDTVPIAGPPNRITVML